MTRWLVTGAGGQLGSHLVRLLGSSALGLTRAELDITSQSSVDSALSRVRPSVLVNAAAHTAVDAAETDPEGAQLVNVTAVGHLARACSALGCRLIHISTDYVFDGAASRPYEITDPPAPRTVYGRTKLAGEQLALDAGGTVVRTAWVYGGPSANFVDTMLRLAAGSSPVQVVEDQIGSPTWAHDLAAAVIDLPPAAGLVHFVNAGAVSWFDLAREVFSLAGHDPSRVVPVSTTEFPRPAPRPQWSVLSTASLAALGQPQPRPWQEALREYLASRRA